MSLKMNDQEIKILANFASINPSMIIKPEGFKVLNTSNSIIANYMFDAPRTFDEFGLYDTPDFLQFISPMDKPEITTHDNKYLIIKGSNNDTARYFTTASDMMEEVPDIEPKFAKVKPLLHFSITNDKIAIINKMASIVKAKYLYFETYNKNIKITVAAGDDLETSLNNYEILIEHDIKVNELTELIKIPMADFKVMAGEYEVKITKTLTKWVNLNGVVYYIVTGK